MQTQEASETVTGPADARALQILAKSIYRELRQSGVAPGDVMTIAGDLLDHVAADLRKERNRP